DPPIPVGTTATRSLPSPTAPAWASACLSADHRVHRNHAAGSATASAASSGHSPPRSPPPATTAAFLPSPVRSPLELSSSAPRPLPNSASCWPPVSRKLLPPRPDADISLVNLTGQIMYQ